MKINVVKRDGSKEPLDIDKIHKVIEWSCEGLSGVSVSEVEIKSQIQFYNNIKSVDIHETMIKSAADLICEDTPNYQYVAGRLINYQLRKSVYGKYTPDNLYDHYTKIRDAGYYTPMLGLVYSQEDWDELQKVINHTRDENLTYVAMEQLRGKYLVKNRYTGEIFETPQIAFMLIAMTLFAKYPVKGEKTRIQWVSDLYNALSLFDISLPTPIMAGVRTTDTQFSSCVLIESDDSRKSIAATTAAIIEYVSNRAGIGIGAGNIRGHGEPVRNGASVSTGVIPWWKLFAAAVKSCSQGGVRGGAATLYYPIWHAEAEGLLVLKNNKGIDENRIRQLDYGIQFNKVMYERFVEGRDITLFSPNQVPGLYDAFFTDVDKFRELYEAAEANPLLRKKTIPAFDLFSMFARERKNTGRVYLMNVDHCNDHGSFIKDKATIRMSNLCVEITLPTGPLQDINDGAPVTKTMIIEKDEYQKYLKWKEYNPRTPVRHTLGFKYTIGSVRNVYDVIPNSPPPMIIQEQFESDSKAEISLCTLAAINWGRVDSPSDFEKPCTLLVRALDALLDYQSYPVIAAEISTRNRRPLGIGIINLAYWMVRNGMTYSNPDLDKIDEYTEAWSYYLIKASVDLAKERGPCPKWDETKYGEGIMPLDTYHKNVDELTGRKPSMDWVSLRADAKKYGIRNSTLMALMPAETSAQISNSTNGIEPPKALVTQKESKEGIFGQVVPNIKKYASKYETAWNVDIKGYLSIVAVLQKWIDMSISANMTYNPTKYPDEKIPMSEMLDHLIWCYTHGIKTLYYFNTFDGAGDDSGEEPLEESEQPMSQDDCESCKL